MSSNKITSTPNTLALRLIAALVSLLIVFGGSLLFSSRAKHDAVSAYINVEKVSVIAVRWDDELAIRQRFTGTIKPYLSGDLFFENSGKIISIWVDNGDFVEKGEKLAQLDNSLLMTKKNELMSAHKRAKIELESALKFYNRVKPLVPHAATQQRLDKLKLELDRSRQSLEQISAQLDNLDISLTHSILRAPYSGQISKKYVENGTVVSQNKAVFLLNGNNSVQAYIGIPVQQVGQIAIGDTYPIYSSITSGEGRISKVVKEINRSTNTITVIFDIVDGLNFIIADTVNVEIDKTVFAPGFWIPNSSLVEGNKGTWSVYMIEGQSIGKPYVVRKSIEILHATENKSYVKGAINEGALVVSSGPFKLVPNQRIVIVDSP